MHQYHSMASTVLRELLEWSQYRPAWQRDALRRLFTKDTLTSNDIDELVAIAKAQHGLDEPRPLQPLTDAHLPLASATTKPVSLVSITHHDGVNALAANQTVTFGPHLTIVFGENAAGKSGYTRILKKACRARVSEHILGNVLSGATPVTPHATIALRVGLHASSAQWTPAAKATDALAAISVFDSHCVPSYLRDKTDVAFRPFSLDIFDRLSALCADVRSRLETEKTLLTRTPYVAPSFPEGTTVHRLASNLTALTLVDRLKDLAALSDAEKQHLDHLRKQQADLSTAAPKKLARELSLRAGRIETLAAHIAEIETTLGPAALTNLTSRISDVQAAQKACDIVQQSALTADLLVDTGGVEWKALWDAAERFSARAYPDATFPVVDANGRCVLCQQIISPDAASRMRHFAEYATSTAQASLHAATGELERGLRQLTSFVVERHDISNTLAELSDENPALGRDVEAFFAAAAQLQRVTAEAVPRGVPLPTESLPLSPRVAVVALAGALRSRSAQLLQGVTSLSPDFLSQLAELSARELLGQHLTNITAEIERKKKIAAYSSCIEDTSTNAITRKSTELTKLAVTDTLRDTFQNELKDIDFTHLEVEIQPAGGARGVLLHQLVFTHAPTVTVTDVLSEGEARALSLAAFLTELSTAPAKSAIIFDDPVSSLDHIWRERIARRLVREASQRQVIVFTHDLLFLHYLRAQATQQDVPTAYQHIRRFGASGICLPDVPWLALSTKQRIGVLNKRVQDAEKAFRLDGPEKYESEAREIYGLIREAWEQALSEVLLNGVIERYRVSIETTRARVLHDITAHDLTRLEQEMTEASRWISGHAGAAADGTPIPTPTAIRQRVDALDSWVTHIKNRR